MKKKKKHSWDPISDLQFAKKSWSGHPLGFIRTWCGIIPCWLGPISGLLATNPECWWHHPPSPLVWCSLQGLLSSGTAHLRRPTSHLPLLDQAAVPGWGSCVLGWCRPSLARAPSDEGDGHKDMPLRPEFHQEVESPRRSQDKQQTTPLSSSLPSFLFPTVNRTQEGWDFLSLPLHHLLLPSGQKDQGLHCPSWVKAASFTAFRSILWAESFRLPLKGENPVPGERLTFKATSLLIPTYGR